MITLQQHILTKVRLHIEYGLINKTKIWDLQSPVQIVRLQMYHISGYTTGTKHF